MAVTLTKVWFLGGCFKILSMSGAILSRPALLVALAEESKTLYYHKQSFSMGYFSMGLANINA